MRGGGPRRSDTGTARRRLPAVLAAGAAALGAVMLVTGCTISTGAAGASTSSDPVDSNPLVALIQPKLTTSVVDGAVGASPGDPVTVGVVDGRLTEVTLTNPDGKVVDGAVAPDGLSWATTEQLGYNRTYTLQAEAYGLGGATTTTMSFTTSAPGNLTKPYVMPGDGSVVGIGQPVAVQFDENIPDRKAAEDAITVTTNPPVDGAFYWLNNREVRWRPQNYWTPGTTVTVDVEAYGRDLGKGLFGQEDVHSSFTIGDAVIIRVDDDTKQVTVDVAGKAVKTMPTSMGKNATPTDNGVYIIGDRFDHMIMDSSTYGVPINSSDGYRTPVDWATRMSYSGIFFHSAPWSIAEQGNTNTSHGCLNLSPSNAKWIFDNTKRGDVVVVENTVGGTLSGTDGLGDWNIPWETWSAGNA
ncbi:L,D-transpeptidase [Prescottella subtropica]|uniref:L,D-transpeptidase n=1 Tax=Prescottella subtropica TaxID=2545757 RepID=UPI003BA93C56